MRWFTHVLYGGAMRRIAFIGGMVFNSEKEEFAPATVLCESGYITDIIEDDLDD